MSTQPAAGPRTGVAAPKGPASYFPSIERSYGQPVEHWIGFVREQHAAGRVKHGELVAWPWPSPCSVLSHATAVVAHTLGLIAAEA